MEENNVENAQIIENITVNNGNNQQIAGAIILAGIIIAGAILLKGGTSTPTPNGTAGTTGTVVTGSPAKVGSTDRTIGNRNAKITIIVYEDFQCPFCERFYKDAEQQIRDTYVKNGEVLLVYRDFAFLGGFVKPYVAENDESINASQASMCAHDQGKFWEYHDYLYNHQNGENQGSFSRIHLKEFASAVGLDRANFDQCLDKNKYAKAVADAKTEASAAGVKGTPKGFILKGGKVVATIDGAQPFASVKLQIDNALK